MNEGDARCERLLAAIGRGEEEAFLELYDEFERPAYSVALRTVGDRGTAEEVVQEAFVKIWKGAASYDGNLGAPSSWIFTITKRTAIDHLRRGQRVPPPSEQVRDTPGKEDIAGDAWGTWQVNVILSGLPAEQRKIVDMFVIEGYTHKEVSERLEIPLGTVKSTIYRGLRDLRAQLEAAEALEGLS